MYCVVYVDCKIFILLKFVSLNSHIKRIQMQFLTIIYSNVHYQLRKFLFNENEFVHKSTVYDLIVMFVAKNFIINQPAGSLFSFTIHINSTLRTCLESRCLDVSKDCVRAEDEEYKPTS